MKMTHFLCLSLAAAWSGLLAVAVGAGGCGSVVATSEPGVFVPNLKGTYDLANVTTACSGLFDGVVTIVQDEENIAIQSSNAGFTDLAGTIDSTGTITATGASTFGKPFDCTGVFADSSITGVCLSELTTCTLNDFGDEVCSEIPVSCAFSYRRR
jgi:hypothetical protein